MAGKRNAVGGERRWWGTMPVLPGAALTATTQQMEAMGFEGVFVLQIYGPPFVPLAAAVTVTKSLKLGTGIAIAGTRSPVETAYAAMDLDRISDGRFILGLGSSIPSCTEGMYGMPPAKPLGSLRETVDVIRYVIANAHKGLDPYNGTYFKADFAEMMLTAPPLRDRIPIWIAALQEKMTDLAIEIGDGLMVHALWSANFTANVQKPVIEAALAKHGRKRTDIEINAWPWIAVNDYKQQAINDARATVAAYSGYKQYEPFFEKQDFGDQARACQLALGDHGDVASVVHNVSDEMVLAFCACGSVEDVLEQIEPYWDVVDSLAPMTPYRDLSMEKLMFYYNGLFKLVAAARSQAA
jgi:alkanesulfonate monooxygenase SsuD/methylene tetrahydromethanopterin reductase-like flavin-dependent oxidoreductase (luciferase family)